MGQFYLTDLTVFKVMFSAIVTAMLGAFWLGRLGLLDLSRVYVPETFVIPQLAGGLIFGVGFAISGLCPGTSCVAAATGRGDGLATAGGMFAGVLATGLFFEPLKTFYDSTPRGAFTLPQALGLPYGLVVVLVVAVAIAGFAVAERIETPTSAHARPVWLGAVAVGAAALAPLAGSPYAAIVGENRCREACVDGRARGRPRHRDRARRVDSRPETRASRDRRSAGGRVRRVSRADRNECTD